MNLVSLIEKNSYLDINSLLIIGFCNLKLPNTVKFEGWSHVLHDDIVFEIILILPFINVKLKYFFADISSESLLVTSVILKTFFLGLEKSWICEIRSIVTRDQKKVYLEKLSLKIFRSSSKTYFLSISILRVVFILMYFYEIVTKRP